MDNPTYDEGINIGPLATEVNHVGNGENIQNPDYSDVGPSLPNTTNPPTQNIHEGLYSESTMARETLYENTHSSVPGTLTNGGEQANDGMSGGTTSEVVYDLPPDVDNIDDDKQANGGISGGTTSEAMYDLPPEMNNVDDNCYSSLGPGDSNSQPHTSKAIQQQPSPNDDEYSLLQHK